MDLYKIRQELNKGVALTNINLKVTDYARVSTNHLEQQKSLQNQKEHFEEMIKNNSNWVYVPGYVDDGITGTSDIKRDNFMRMIDDAKKGKFDLIITKEISRFSRNTLDSIKYTRELLSYGVAVLFVNDNINTALPDAELRLTIMASMAQDEIRRLSERVKFGMNRAILRGEILGNNLLYGYKKDKNTKKLIIVEEEAKVVRRIYGLYVIDKLSLAKIVKILNSEGIISRYGKKWATSTISRMIENPKYKGFYCGKKSEIEDYMTKKIRKLNKNEWVIYEDRNKIPPIINSKLWEEANKRLLERKKNNKNKYQDRYLYSGKIFCKWHNTLFYRRVFRCHKKDITWVCSKYLQDGKGSCNTANIRETELNYIFKDLISKLDINLEKVTNILMNNYNHLMLDDNGEDRVKEIDQEINKINIKKDKILDLSIKGILTDEEFREKNNLFNEEIEKLEQKKKLLNKKILSNKENVLKEVIQNKINSLQVLEKIIDLLLKYIYVSKEGEIIKLDIYLNYKINKLINEKYEFKRGFDTKGTKRYFINYQVRYLD